VPDGGVLGVCGAIQEHRRRGGVYVRQQLDGAAQAGLVADLPGDRAGVQERPSVRSPLRAVLD
jgi:hypothetical protein